MLTIKDIVDLAKAGYKPAEVKELLELSKSEDKETPTEKDKETPTEKDKETPAEAHKEDEDNDIDYKALYESTKIELDKAQKENRKKDISSDEDNKTDKDILKDLFKEFM